MCSANVNKAELVYNIHLLKVLNFNQLIKRVFTKKNIVNAFLLFYAESSGPEKYLLQSLVQEKIYYVTEEHAIFRRSSMGLKSSTNVRQLLILREQIKLCTTQYRLNGYMLNWALQINSSLLKI